LGVSSEDKLHESIRAPLQELENAVQSRACVTGITQTDTLGKKATAYYKTFNDVGCLIKDTAFSSLLNDKSESNINERGEGYIEARLDKKTTMHIGIPLGGQLKSVNPLSVKGRPLDPEQPDGEKDIILEPLYIENLHGMLPSTKFQIAQDWTVSAQNRYGSNPYGSVVYEGLLTDRKAYLSALTAGREVKLLVNPHDLIENVIIPLCRDVSKTMHSKGRVHGDIKPANVLFVGGGPKLIDARGCSIGNISSTYTPAWCAPEQTLGKPIDPAADVYALAMMAMKTIGGEIYGEVKNFKMPGSTTPIQVLDTDGVWIDSKSGLSEPTRNAWRAALVKFLSFEPSKRPQNGEALAEELEKLIKAHPVRDAKLLKVHPSQKARLHRVSVESTKELDILPGADFPEGFLGKEFPAWILDDTYANLV